MIFDAVFSFLWIILSLQPEVIDYSYMPSADALALQERRQLAYAVIATITFLFAIFCERVGDNRDAFFMKSSGEGLSIDTFWSKKFSMPKRVLVVVVAIALQVVVLYATIFVFPIIDRGSWIGGFFAVVIPLVVGLSMIDSFIYPCVAWAIGDIQPTSFRMTCLFVGAVAWIAAHFLFELETRLLVWPGFLYFGILALIFGYSPKTKFSWFAIGLGLMAFIWGAYVSIDHTIGQISAAVFFSCISWLWIKPWLHYKGYQTHMGYIHFLQKHPQR